MAFTPTDNVVEDVMARFDFEKAHKLMVFLNWKWTKSEGVPSVKEIKDSVRGYLQSALNGPTDFEGCWSGGFKATKSHGHLSLDFVPVESYEILDNEKRRKFYTPMTKEEIDAKRRKWNLPVL